MKNVASRLVDWYAQQGRQLPWRETQDPYRIWISEIILQQTRVVQGLAYYERFIQTFPDIFQLAAAPETAVLKVWEGLGYYSRARNLHETAQFVVQAYNGNFPQTVEQLLKLKGIGAYTARAIAAFAFAQPVVVLDGNVFRILSRLHNDHTPIDAPNARKHYQPLADALLNESLADASISASVFNSALMDLGATVCLPQNPKCNQCPIHTTCAAFAQNTTSNLPIKQKTKQNKIRYYDFYYIKVQDNFAIRQRVDAGFWHKLYELPNREVDNFSNLPEYGQAIASTKHIFTHFEMRLRAVECDSVPPFLSGTHDFIWISQSDIKNYPFPTALHRLFELIYKPKQTLF